MASTSSLLTLTLRVLALLLLLLTTPSSLAQPSSPPPSQDSKPSSLPPLIEARQGKIQGVWATYNKTGKRYQAFRGIPYARPPIGQLRFAKPLPHPGFSGVFRAEDYGPVCVQCPIELREGLPMSEDCLTLNVFVPDSSTTAAAASFGEDGKLPTENSTYPVLVYIHGGAFVSGTARMFEMANLVTEGDVILVTLQYRLGILGFLSTGDTALPGNYGLWDQLMAVRWIQENIASFGGDPQAITVSGESAGSASISYLTLSPASRGLFQKALLQSGMAVSGWAFTPVPGPSCSAFARSVGCRLPSAEGEAGSAELLLRCLREVPVGKFQTDVVANRSVGWKLTSGEFVPTVDGEFIADSPHNLLHDPQYLQQIGFYDLDFLTGVTNNEGALLYQMASHFEYDAETLLTDPEFFDTDMVKVLLEQRFEESNPGMADIASFYYTAPRLLNSTTLNVNEVLLIEGDVGFYVPLVENARAVAINKRPDKRNLVYYFNYYPKFMTGGQSGIPHTMDMAYEKDTVEDAIPLYEGDPALMDSDDDLMGQYYRAIILDFVKYSNPSKTFGSQISEEWRDFDLVDESYLSLSPNSSSVLRHPFARRVALWTDLLPKFKATPVKADEE